MAKIKSYSLEFSSSEVLSQPFYCVICKFVFKVRSNGRFLLISINPFCSLYKLLILSNLQSCIVVQIKSTKNILEGQS